jgi:hypothetical protein
MAVYPAHLARRARLGDGRMVTIRPVRPEDEPGKRAFFERLSGRPSGCASTPSRSRSTTR